MNVGVRGTGWLRYDAFLSYNRADRDWTRALFERISGTEYDGRLLRAWLDEQVLDPGSLSSERELETALDRSHRLILVASPEALSAPWVQHEYEYFLRTQDWSRIVVLVHRACELPSGLTRCEQIAWPGAVNEGPEMAALLRLLQPQAESARRYSHGRAVRRATDSARRAMGTGFNPGATQGGQALLNLLLKPRLQDLDEEGLALAGFRSAGQALSELDDREGYNLRLLLGEILAEAQLRDAGYAQVAAEYARSQASTSFLTIRNRAVNGRTGEASTVHLLGTVARAASKLADLDASRVDLSTLAALLQNLDQRAVLDGPAHSVVALVGRTLAKLRGSRRVDALLCALSEWGGNASHLAVAAAVSCELGKRDPAVYATEELEQRAARRTSGDTVRPPTGRIARLLWEPHRPLGLNSSLVREVENARRDYERAFGAWNPAEASWQGLRHAQPLTQLHGGSLVGNLCRITLANMEVKAQQLGPGDIAVLTEPRIVEALFAGAGGFLIDEQQADAPLGTRLRGRGARWATCSQATLAQLEDGSAVVWWARENKPLRGYKVSRRLLPPSN